MKTTRFFPTDAGSSSGGPPSGPAGGDTGGSFPSPVVTGLQGTPVCATVPTTGQVLVFDGTTWCPAADPGGPPHGPAGGDLAGTYPNPTVARINGSPLGTTIGAAVDDWLRWDGAAWSESALLWRPLMATDDGGAHYYVLTDGDGTAVMALS